MTTRKLTTVPGVQLDVDLTPPGWHQPRRGDVEAFVDVIRKLFPEAVSHTVGVDRIEVRLLALEEVETKNVKARRAAAMSRLFMTMQTCDREHTVDSGALERRREARFPVPKIEPPPPVTETHPEQWDEGGEG